MGTHLFLQTDKVSLFFLYPFFSSHIYTLELECALKEEKEEK